MRPREHTLFRPAPEIPKTVGPAAAPAGGPIFEPEDEERASLVDLLVFALRAAQRRRRLALVLFLAGLAFTALAARLVPRTYESTARMLVVHTPSSAGGPVGNAFTADDAKRDAKEFEQQIYARSNLEGIVKDAHLVARWDDMRQPLRRIFDLFASTPSEPEKVEALVLTLEKAIHVTIDASAITISVDWMERTAAQDIAAASLKRFSDARWAVEVAAVADSIGVLDGHVKAAREAMATAAAEVLEEKGRRVAEPAVRAARGSSHRDPLTDARLGDLQRKLQELNDQRRARLAQLENHLAELSGTYGPQHPAIVALKSTIDATRRDTPEMASLRAQEAELASRRRADRAARSLEIEDVVPAAPTVDYASSADRFEAAQRRYEALVARIDAANIEKQVAEVTFKRKYEVVHPADLPLGAKKPVVLMTMVGGILASLLLVLAGALAADAWSGVFFEPKRVRDDLGLPVLGEVKLS